MQSDSDVRLLGFTFVAHTLIHALVLTVPILVPLWLVEFDVTRYEAGLAVALMVGLYGLMGVPAGVLSDRYGSDRLIVVCLVGTGLACLLTLVATDFVALALLLGLVGAAAGLYHSPALSLISRQAAAPPRAFAYHGLGANVGVGGGPLLAAVALAVVGWEQVLALFAVPLLVVGVLFYVRGPEDRTYDPVYADGAGEVFERVTSLATLAFGLVLVMYLFKGLYYRGGLTFLPDFLGLTAEVAPISIAGAEVPAARWIYSGVLLVGAGGQLVGAHLGEQFGTETTIVGAFAATSVVLVGLAALAGNALLVAVAAFGVLLFVTAPLQQNLIATYTPHASRGLGFGLIFGFNHGVGAVGAALAGWLVTTGGYGLVFYALALAPVGALLAVVGIGRLASPMSSADGEAV